MKPEKIVWTDELIMCLRDLAAAGHTYSNIAKMMGLGRNSVIGKAHRLNLPDRPSPIIRNADGSLKGRKPYERKAKPELPPLASVDKPIAVRVDPPPVAAKPVFVPLVAPPLAPVEPRPVAVNPLSVPPINPTFRRLSECCWPIGEPGTKGFRFCEASTVPGRSYCLPHCEKAYVRVGDQKPTSAFVLRPL